MRIDCVLKKRDCLNKKAKDVLYQIDKIIDSCYHIYSDKKLSKFAKLSFSMLEKTFKISSKYAEGFENAA
jgi:hypothetical protein